MDPVRKAVFATLPPLVAGMPRPRIRTPGLLSWPQQTNIAMPKADKMLESGRCQFGEIIGQPGMTEMPDMHRVQAYQEENLSRDSRTNNECYEFSIYLLLFLNVTS